MARVKWEKEEGRSAEGDGVLSMEKIIYSLNVEDLQQVAEQEFDRKLSNEEITLIEEKVAENITWYEAIVNAIDATGIMK